MKKIRAMVTMMIPLEVEIPKNDELKKAGKEVEKEIQKIYPEAYIWDIYKRD